MDNYETQEATKQQAKITFSINANGEVEYDSIGLDEWENTTVIKQVVEQAQKQAKATQTKQLTSLTSEFAMHGLALSFIAFISLGIGFTLSRLVSNNIYQPTTTQLSQ